MSRSFERKVIYAASIWQIITGCITIFFYSFYIRGQYQNMGHLSPVESMGVQSIFKSLFTFTVTYGLFFIAIAGLNFIFTKRMVKDGTIQYKLPFFWIGLAVVFFFLNDFISVMLCMAAGVIALSKNRPLKMRALAGSSQD